MVHTLFTLYTTIFCHLTEAYHSKLSKSLCHNITFKQTKFPIKMMIIIIATLEVHITIGEPIL